MRAEHIRTLSRFLFLAPEMFLKFPRTCSPCTFGTIQAPLNVEIYPHDFHAQGKGAQGQKEGGNKGQPAHYDQKSY